MLWAVRQYWKQGEVMKHLAERPQVSDEVWGSAAGVAGAAAAAELPAGTTAGGGRHLRQQQQQAKQQVKQQTKQQGQGAAVAGSSSSRSSRQLLATATAAVATSSSSTKQQQPSRPLMVDVGGNVGWFSINAAAAGARVATFEGEEAGVLIAKCRFGGQRTDSNSH